MKNRILVILFFCLGQLLIAQSSKDTLLIGYTTAPPFIIENNNNLTGINIWLWERVANDLGLNYKLQKMNFSKMLLDLEQGSLDVCINPMTITSKRNKKMEFTHTFFTSNSTIVAPKATSLNNFMEFVKSFFNINFLRGLLALLFIILLFGLITWFFERKKNPIHFRPGWKGVFDGIWWSIVTMTTVGYGDKYPISRGGKIVALIWMFSGLLFISGLTASVASNLTVNKLNNNIEGLNEFKDLKVGTMQNSGTLEFLKNNFFKNIVQYNGVTEGLNDLNTNTIDAFLYDAPLLKYRIKENENFQNLRLLPVRFDLQLYGFGLPKKNHELEGQISQKILEIIESHEWKVVLNEYGLNEL